MAGRVWSVGIVGVGDQQQRDPLAVNLRINAFDPVQRVRWFKPLQTAFSAR